MSRDRFYRSWYLYQEVTHRKGCSGEGPVLWEQPASRKCLEQAGGTFPTQCSLTSILDDHNIHPVSCHIRKANQGQDGASATYGSSKNLRKQSAWCVSSPLYEGEIQGSQRQAELELPPGARA